MTDFVEILYVPRIPANLGTLLRLGVALGWKPDDLAVTTEFSRTVLLGRKGVQRVRPTIIARGSALVELDVTPAAPKPPAEPEPPPEPEPAPEERTGNGFEAFERPRAPAGSRTCTLCPRTFDNAHMAATHIENDHSNPEALTCEHCGGVFGSNQGLRRHVGARHPTPDAYEQPQPPKELPKAFGDTGARKRGTDPTLRCRECGEEFVVAQMLMSHCRTVHGRRATLEERTPVGDAA